MQNIKKYFMTLALLLTAVTGAWADETPLLTIENKDYSDFKSGSKTFDDMVTVTFSNSADNDSNLGWYATSTGSLLTVTGTNGYTITSCKFYTGYGPAETGFTIKGESPSVYLSGGYVYTDANQSEDIGAIGIKKIEVYGGVATATPVDITWDAATPNIATIAKMPAGNVTVSVEYYDLATLADKGLTAAEDAAAKTEAPLAVVADGAVTGGTLMYYVAPDENFSQADAIALAETQWSADIPTAETIGAAGTCYVWYYIKGDAEHSDTDPQRLAVTLLPEPTYTVEFAEGTPETDKWKAEPNAGVKKGQTVTVTYTGSKKIIGVKAEKKAKAAEKTITIGEQNYTVQKGETWKQFITRNQLSGWSVTSATIYTWGVCMDEPFSKLHVSSDGTNWTQLVLSSQDAPIDTDKQYKWVQEEIGSGGVGVGEPLF